jgi:hypothetical protein
MLRFSVPSGYRRSKLPVRPKLDPLLPVIDRILEEDQGRPCKQRIHFLAVDLPHSDACFVRAYPAETVEAFCDGHNAAFTFLGRVPQSMLYDNTRLAVVRILGDGTRQRTRTFAELQSHYLFADRFGRKHGLGSVRPHRRPVQQCAGRRLVRAAAAALVGTCMGI